MDLASGLHPWDDYPLAKPETDDAFFVEGQYFYAYDPKKTTGFWINLYTMPYDFSLVVERLAFYLPGRRFAFTKGYGRGRTATTNGAATLFFHCREPFKRWHIVFDGNVQVVPQELTLREIVRDGVRVPMRFECDVQCTTPAWIPPAFLDPSATGREGGVHAVRSKAGNLGVLTQFFRFDAKLTFEGETVELSSIHGIRHRTRMSLDFSGVRWHHFNWAMFASGRAFGITQTHRKDGLDATYGHLIMPDGTSYRAEVVEISPVEAVVPYGEKFRAVLKSDLGLTEITGETVDNAAWTMMPAGEILYGLDVTQKDASALLHGNMLFTWEGEQAYGLFERSRVASEIKPWRG